MRVLRLTSAFASIALAIMLSAPAFADDWALECRFKGGVDLQIRYYAGDPSHSVEVVSAGTSKLQVAPAAPAARLTAPSNYIFIVDRERSGGPNAHSLVIRVNTSTMKANLTAGNGVSYDFTFLDGACLEL